jgi:hypothetical protein
MKGGEDMFRGLATAVIGGLIVLTALGLALGASLGETDLFNPATGAAQARSIDAQTQMNTTQAQLEIEQHRAEIAAQQAADALALEHQSTVYAEERSFLERQHELELQQQQRAFEQEMAMMETRQVVYLGVGSVAILAVTIAVVYYLYACGRTKRLQEPQVAGRRQADKPDKQQRARQPTRAVSRQSIAAKDTGVTPARQDQQGGNGRGDTRSFELPRSRVAE